MSCLFNSLSHFEKISSNGLRKQICDYLQTNPVLYDGIRAKKWIKWEKNTNLKNYVNSMRNTSTWGGAIEIRCYVQIYKKKVVVLHKSKKIKFPIKPCNNKIFLIYTGNHYEPRR